MKKAILVALTMCCIIFVSAFSAHASRGIKITTIENLNHRSGKLGEFKALVIGINDYADPKIPDLETAVKDAGTMAGILAEKYGFTVERLFDRKATRAAIYQKLRSLAASTRPDDSVLIYFAGHGDLDRTYDDGWWIPSDATGGNPVTYFSNGQVQMAMRSMKARHVLLISDSCYSGTLFGKSRALPPVIDDRYYLGLYNEKSRWGMTSGNKEPVSDAGSEGHSVFAYQLLKELKRNAKPFISIQEIYTRIAPIISNNSEQTPLCRPIRNTGDQGGEFVFVAAVESESVPVAAVPRAGGVDKETIFWQSIQSSDDPSLFQAYLEQFPNGTFAPIARRKLEILSPKKEVASISPEDTRPKAAPEILKARLFVETQPENARVRILNIKPKFRQGIELQPGSYHIEVAARGHKIQRQWIKLGADEKRRVAIKLARIPENDRKKLGADEERLMSVEPSKKPEYYRIALVIANSRYGPQDALKNPENDANDIASALQDLGFDVIRKTNANHKEMKDLIRDFSGRLREKRVGLFFYAGHGVQIDGRNYLIPVNHRIREPSDVRYEAVNAQWVLDKMESAGSRVNIVILDASQEKLIRSLRTRSKRGLAVMNMPIGSYIAYATIDGGVAEDGKGRNGVYTKHLLKHIKTPGLKITEVFRNVRKGVFNETNQRQLPWDHNSLMGNFYFKDSY